MTKNTCGNTDVMMKVLKITMHNDMVHVPVNIMILLPESINIMILTTIITGSRA